MTGSRLLVLLGAMVPLLLAGCTWLSGSQNTSPAHVLMPQAKDETAIPERPTVEQVGEASWYGAAQNGKETASGEVFDQNDLTAAHPTLPLGSKAVITNLENGKSVTVKINDRGPYAKGRKIDLSRAAARQIGMTKKGVARVKIEAGHKPLRRTTKTQPIASTAPDPPPLASQ